MEKKHIIKFLKSKKRGVYALLVEMYADVIRSMAITMALEIIREDLEKDSEEKAELNYFSFAQAVAKFKKKAKAKPESRKREFKDAHEQSDKQKPAGTFTLGQ
jgi:hypothetical protein